MSRRLEIGSLCGLTRLAPILLTLGLLSFPGCGGGERAQVAELLDSGSAPLPVELVSTEGGRDGAQTRAVFTFRGGADTELVLDLLVAYDPQPVLAEGNWTYAGPTGRGEGSVRAEAVRFVGGQGEGASVGGTYLLLDDGRSRFRVTLPLQRVEVDGWPVDGGR